MAAMRWTCVLLGIRAARSDDIVSIVTTAEGFERGATAAQLPAYDLYNQAVRASSVNDMGPAVQMLEEALRIYPEMPEALINLGNFYGDLSGDGRMDLSKALELYEKAIEYADFPRIASQAESNLGNLLQKRAGKDLGGLKEAAAHLERAIAHDPSFVDARFNLATLLQDLNRIPEARAQYRAVLDLDKAHGNARLNLANTYFEAGLSDEAAKLQWSLIEDDSITDGVRLNALNNLGQTYRDANRHGMAEEVFEKAVELFPADFTSLANLLVARRTLCNWWNYEATQFALVQAARQACDLMDERLARNASIHRRDVQLPMMPYDASLLQHVDLQLGSRLAAARTLQAFGRRKSNPPTIKKRLQLRVGYLSFDFREHPMGYLTRRLVSDPIHVDAVALSYGEDDASNNRARALQTKGGFVEMYNTTAGEAHSKLMEADLDVVVDLMTHTRGARLELASESVAPSSSALMVSYLGYPGPAGGVHWDYTLSDKVVQPPDHSNGHAEPLIYLPFSYQANDYSPRSPALVEGDFVPSDRVRFCNVNQVDKYEPVSWSLWMNVLRRVPGSSLSLYRMKDPLGAHVVRHLSEEAMVRGIHPARITWLQRLPRKAHAQRIARDCDLFLDHLLYGAHTTGADALWAAVPLLTVNGWGGSKSDQAGRFSSRVGASLVKSLGISQYVLMDSLRDFEDVAVHVKPQKLRMATLAATARAPLFDALNSVQNVERALQAAVEVTRAGRYGYHVVSDPAQPRHNDRRRDCWRRQVSSALGGNDDRPCLEDADAHTEVDYQNASDPGPSLDRVRAGAAFRFMNAYPDDANALAFRGLAAHLNGDNIKAAPYLRRACARASWTAHFWFNYAHVLRQLEQPANAAAAYLTGLRVAGRGFADVSIRSNLEEAIRASTKVEGRPDLDANFALSALEPLHAVRRLGVGAALDELGRGSEALAEWFHAVRLRHDTLQREHAAVNELQARRDAYAARIEARARAKLVIVIYCDEYGQTWWPNWGPSSLKTNGLGGSEEAVVFVGRELVKRGHAVEVYNECSDADLGLDAYGIRWLRHATFQDEEPPDVFVAWRYHVSTAVVAPYSPTKVYAWLQDLPGYTSWTPAFCRGLRGIFTLSQFHTRSLPPHARPRAYETPNGIDPTFLVDGVNQWDQFVYGSAPNRGLYDLLLAWPLVKAALPSATLRVYYGFSAAVVKWGKQHVPLFDEWRAEVELLMKQDGVVLEGMVPHDALARAYAAAGFYLYPTTYPETGCVSVMKAMAMGAIPITSRHAESVVPELTNTYDLGPVVPRTAESHIPVTLVSMRRPDPGDDAWRAAYAESIIDAAKRAQASGLDAHRRDMKAYARERFLWKHVAKRWEDHFLGEAGGP